MSTESPESKAFLFIYIFEGMALTNTYHDKTPTYNPMMSAERSHKLHHSSPSYTEKNLITLLCI